MAPMSRSMAWTPNTEPSVVVDPLAGAGSMKWFMPPTRATGSIRQAAMQDPRIVLTTTGSRVAYTCPMWMVTSGRSTTLTSPFTGRLPSRLLIDRVAHVLEAQAHAEQGLGMTKEQVATRLEQLDEASDEALLQGAVEVDDDVAAEDTIELGPDRPGVFPQVDPAERHQVLHLGAHRHQPFP